MKCFGCGQQMALCTCVGAYRPKTKHRYMPKSAIQKMVRKTWLLYIQSQQSQHPVDLNIYRTQREVAVRAIDAGNPAWKKEFELP